MAQADRELRATGDEYRRRRLNAEEKRLAARIAAEHGIPTDHLLSRRRIKHIANARHHFIAVLRWTTMMSYPDLAALVGMADHTSIIYAVRKYEAILNGERAA
jgi:chromosomal replication initiation ATPase DnaA